MPGIASLSPAAQAAIGLLLATVAALWIRPGWLWIAGLSATVAASAIAGFVEGPAAAAFVLLALALVRLRAAGGTARAAYGAAAAAVWLLLALHAWPGFHNPVAIRDAVLSPGALPYSQYANVDKGLAGVVLLGVLGRGRLRPDVGWRRGTVQAGVIVVATITVAMAASLALGFVRFEPRWTPLFWTWAPVNLLLTCASEEAFFRGFLQRETARGLDGRRHAGAIAVAASAVLFGLAHAAGGWRYVLLSTVAGTGYALAWQRTGRIEAPILAHFAVNATHFLLFTYPALA